MKQLLTSLIFLAIVILTSCTPPTKGEALEYYEKIRFDICDDILYRLDEQRKALQEYTSDPRKLTDGPSDQEHTQLLSEQRRIITDLRSTLELLEKIDLLGDEAEFLENLKIYLYTRLNFEEDVMLKMIISLKDGITPEESIFLGQSTTQLLDLHKQEEIYLGAEELFLDEFQIAQGDFDTLTE